MTLYISVIESISDYLPLIIFYFPLGIIGIYRWSVWLTKKIIAKKYKPVADNGYRDTLSIVVPIYNEDPIVLERALKSWIGNNPEEIIAAIDYRDEGSLALSLFKKYQEDHPNIKTLVINRKGKREALADGIRIAKSNIIALVDSDTVWDPNIKNTLIFPFIDKSVGGVLARQDVLETNTLARRVYNILLDHRYFDEMAFLSVVGDALTCISGRTAVYRKEAIKDLCDALENETFWGLKCISGDDKCLTRLIQERGWKVRYQMNARVLTPGAPFLFTFFMQYLRWTKNSYRSDLKSLTSRWIWKREKWLAYHMIDTKTQPFTLLVGPIYFIFSIIYGHWLVAGILLVWWHISRGIKLYPHLKHRPSDIFIIPIYTGITFFMAVVKIYAMVTMRRQGWITRWHKDLSQEKFGVDSIFYIVNVVIPYIATTGIVFLLSLSVLKYKNVALVPNDTNSLSQMQINTNAVVDHCVQPPSANLENTKLQEFVYYTVEKEDNFSTIAYRYDTSFSAIIKANADIVANPHDIKIGQRIKIPVFELKNPHTRESLISFKKPKITFYKESNTIFVEGRRNVVNLSRIYNALNDKTILEKTSGKQWILKANLVVKKGVTLVIDGEEVSWLKLKSDQRGFVGLQSNDGNILIKNTKITSWNEENQSPDFNYMDGRSFVLARQNGRMDIINSELSFLGYNDGLRTGVTWHTAGNTPDRYLITGQVSNSKFLNNYFGVQLSGVTGMNFFDNEVAFSAKYGIDISKDVDYLVMKNNRFYDNSVTDCFKEIIGE